MFECLCEIYKLHVQHVDLATELDVDLHELVIMTVIKSNKFK